jgi:hypothetical protein
MNLMICTLQLIFSDDQIEESEMGGACSMYGESRCAHRILVRKPEGKRPLGTPRRRWKIILRWIFRM